MILQLFLPIYMVLVKYVLLRSFGENIISEYKYIYFIYTGWEDCFIKFTLVWKVFCSQGDPEVLIFLALPPK